MVEALVWIVALGVIIAFMWRGRGRPPRRIGSASVGTVYDMLNNGRRKAVGIIVEGRAEARNEADADGVGASDLEDPTRRKEP